MSAPQSQEQRSTAPSGSWRNTSLARVYYGPGCLKASLSESLQLLDARKVLIITGKSLATKTPVISDIEKDLQSQGLYGATFADIGQHAPVEGIKAAAELAKKTGANVLLAVGGGSPIDSAKAVSHFVQADSGGAPHMPIIAVPTTLSVAETTQNAGYTDGGQKVGVARPELFPRVLIYDAELSTYTPEKLWLSTGIRALDHAIETLYRPQDPNIPRYTCLGAIRDLFTYLPLCKRDPTDLAVRQRLFIAGYHSLAPEARLGALGLSHGIGHKVGATYGLAHGLCSCLSLARTIRYTAAEAQPPTPLEQLAALADALAFIPPPYAPPGASAAASTSPGVALREQSREELARKGVLVGEAVQKLVDDLGLHTTLKSAGIPRSEIEGIATRLVGGEDKRGSDLYKGTVKILNDVAK